MKCPKCQFDNPEGAKFCIECGHKFGKELAIVGERKQTTVLFSDLSGYTGMSERLDPEEVKEIMNQVFGEITFIVNKYDGSIQKFIGDAVVAFFGVPKAHEDDPVRAIRAVKEIHSFVEGISLQVEQKVGQSLSMHTGINTGLVVTGQVDQDGGATGVLGDTINLASRLSDLAKPGEILVGVNTYHQAEQYFNFEMLGRTTVKGKTEPVPVYKLISKKEKPITIHRVSGLKADFIGRKMELGQLRDAVRRLQEGKGTVFAICGDPGTGKSRLIEELRATLDLKTIQWAEGHAHAYSQNISYFPLVDLFNSAWQIDETERPEAVKEKIELGITRLIGKKDIVPYIGSLYSLSYPEIEGVSPEFWKSRLADAIQVVLKALTQRGPIVIYLEDLHWADPSSIALLRSILMEFFCPALFLCVYRPPFNLFTSQQLSNLGMLYQEIHLIDLLPSEVQDMMESLLQTKAIPFELSNFIQERAEGNPFYLEEMINSLIESGVLKRDNGVWKLTRSISKSDIPSTVQGLISARLDRLDKDTRRVLQEASVIGRNFLSIILKKVTELENNLSDYLNALEQLDLIRIKSSQPDLEYVFKHALTQEVVYNGLLKKERQALHERIALVVEEVFCDRLPEFYETLAFHFKQGHSLSKALDYLVKSGEKSLNRYAVEESHQYYKEAFDILSQKPFKTKEEKELLIDILLKWAFVFYCRGDFKELTNFLIAHQDLAESMEDRARLGMFYTRLGYSLGFGREDLKEARHYLSKALKLGEEIKNQQVIGYACVWLSWTCAEMGLLDEAIAFGKRAQKISELLQSEPYLYFNSLSAMGQAYWHKGEIKNAFDVGRLLLNYGQKNSNIRSMVLGYYVIGWSHFTGGDFTYAAESFQLAIKISADPYYSQFPRLGLIYSYLASGQLEKVEEPLKEILDFTEKLSPDIIRTPALALLYLVSIAKGHLGQGVKKFQEVQQIWFKKDRKCLYAASEYMMGSVYLKLSQGGGKFVLPMIIKNIGFLLRTIPIAKKKAEGHFLNSINVAREIGAKSTLGRAYLDLGLLYKAKRKKDQSKDCLSKATQIFKQCEAEGYLKQAEEALASIEERKVSILKSLKELF